MGTSYSTLDPDFSRNLHQESAYITYSSKFGKQFSSLIDLPHGPVDPRGNSLFSSPESSIRIFVKQTGDFPLSAVKSTLVMSACAFQGRDDIDNILDGYSSALFLQVDNVGNTMRLRIAQKPVEDDMFQRELNPLSQPPRPNKNDNCWMCTRMYNPDDPSILAVPLTGAEKKNMSCWNGGIWSGLFNGKLGLWKLIRPSTMVYRTTGHQPIWTQNNIFFCSTINWQQVRVDEDAKTNLLVCHPLVESVENSPLLQELPEFPRARQVFQCMHPHEDVNFVTKEGRPEPRMITYSFTQAKLSSTTYITFYEFGLESPLKDNTSGRAKKITNFTVNHYAQLHMFGFTRNYYLIFANPLSVDKLAMCWKGTPVLKALDDNYECNLVIYLVRRPDAPSFLPEFMAVDTRQQGNMYHTVNCYEEYRYTPEELDKMYRDPKYAKDLPPNPDTWTPEQKKFFRHYFPSRVILDGWASQLNAARESSQFQLRQDDAHSVYENQGSLYRYVMYLDETFRVRACYNVCVCPEIISTIDFHCINPYNYGRSYRNFWLVAHHRERPVSKWNPLGQIEHVESILYAIQMPSTLLDLDEEKLRDTKLLDRMTGAELPWRTSQHLPKQWQGHLISYYMRTPMFVARSSITDLSGTKATEEKERKEKDGFLFVWCYRCVHDFREVDTNADWERKDESEAIKQRIRTDEEEKKEAVSILTSCKLIHRPPSYGQNHKMMVDENLLLPYSEVVQRSSLGKVVPLTEDPQQLQSVVRPLRSGAFVLIFDASTFTSESKPWIIEFDDNDIVIPYSVHSFTHQYQGTKETEGEKKARVEKVERDRQAAVDSNRRKSDVPVEPVRKDTEMVPLTFHHDQPEPEGN